MIRVMRPLRVLQVNCRYREYGGEERAVENEAAMLRSAGHEVLQFEASNEGGTAATLASLSGSVWNPRQATLLRRAVREWRPDVAHVHNLWFSLSPSVLAMLRREGVPVVVTIHNYRLVCASADLWRDGRPCRECVGRGFAGPGVEHGCYRNSRPLSATVASASATQARLVRSLPPSRVIVPSEFLRGVLVEGGFGEELFTVIPWTTPDPGDRLDPPSISQDVYFVGRLEPGTKGVERLVAAWNRATAAGLLKGLTLNLVGSGPLEGGAAIEGPNVRSFGHLGRNEIDRLLLSGRALVVPSLWDEPFGLVAIEAFAAGLPVISTDRGALPETVGLLARECVFPATDDGAWQRGLSQLSDDRFVDSRGTDARRLWLERFAPSSGIERLEGVFENVLRSAVGTNPNG
jgi:glycosyltransferase involved in cell wall biosynthesis